MLQLAASDKYISVNEWQGVTRIHIHTYFKSNGGGGEPIPTKKGVTLTTEEWKALKHHADHIDAMIAFAEDEHILSRKSASTQPPLLSQQPITEIYQYKPQQLAQVQRITPCQQHHEPKPFGQ